MSTVQQQDVPAFVLRTFVPLIVGFVLSVAVTYGFHLDSASATLLVTAGVTAAYTALAHIVEDRWPSAGKYLVSLGLVRKELLYVSPQPPPKLPLPPVVKP